MGRVSSDRLFFCLHYLKNLILIDIGPKLTEMEKQPGVVRFNFYLFFKYKNKNSTVILSGPSADLSGN